ncbi:hypothetical protein ROZALSC1DRAFT_29842 [Rozella allomycis CSF55]|uniref:ATPase inhibitor, mitochondrial n=1 Tax=Rozella allomycis (strain CSF55) TaxID=988480 RepID=A0A075ANQ0_ROZAC|nr:hypothetical protein O9G_004541 [Rozella allomycis CSF55]RKP18484.1 hypothetical protein ROZALSC1DRAFT_29842 [Rozella allomycis CSF55]|eukprot:EPZ31509.1 hypothetical protein O9G_004541 [Rozella allomycis CSF55]
MIRNLISRSNRRSIQQLIRGEASSPFGKKEKAAEEMYFRQKDKEKARHILEHPEELETELQQLKSKEKDIKNKK